MALTAGTSKMGEPGSRGVGQQGAARAHGKDQHPKTIYISKPPGTAPKSSELPEPLRNVLMTRSDPACGWAENSMLSDEHFPSPQPPTPSTLSLANE